jgi:hypothetical protein
MHASMQFVRLALLLSQTHPCHKDNHTMAHAAQKKQAVANAARLKTLHTAFLIVNGLFLVSHFLLNRPGSIKAFLVFSVPALFLQYQLERLGRPRYDDRGALLRAGDDLNQPGLTEWMHDVIYVTWICVILSIAFGSNKVWYLYSSVSLARLFLGLSISVYLSCLTVDSAVCGL